jgi:CheY-like chemotaxis protein
LTDAPGRRNVLVVEDDELTREVVTLMLEGQGYAVQEAGDGQEALDRLREGPRPGCILLDLRMPRMDGRQFRSRQRQDPALAGVPVVVVSAEPELAAEAASLGAAGYLQKPVRAEALLAAVRRHC